MRAGSTGAAGPVNYGTADAQYANFAFASEIGSGVYEISGSVITVYTFEPGYILRNAEPDGGRPEAGDLARLHLDDRHSALGLEPDDLIGMYRTILLARILDQKISGSVITVYTFEPAYTLRTATPNGGRPGIRLIFPSTVGFFNFATSDLLHLELPHSIGALSFEPGVELDYWINDVWDVYPYLKAGGTVASSAAVNAVIWGAGVRSDYRFAALAGTGLWRAQLSYAAAHYHDVPSESFTRLRNGAELRRTLDLTWHSRAFEFAPYAIADVYFNAPSGASSGISPRTFQYEIGLMFGMAPRWEVLHGWPLPRLGVGYREAGVLSGWRLVLGDPF